MLKATNHLTPQGRKLVASFIWNFAIKNLLTAALMFYTKIKLLCGICHVNPTKTDPCTLTLH